MKTLNTYTDAGITKALNNAGAFFAFSNQQFAEKKEDGVVYVNLGAGLLCPKNTARELKTAIDNITAEGIAKRVKEYGMEKIILHELVNHEYEYTGDIESTVNALSGYPVTTSEIAHVAQGGSL